MTARRGRRMFWVFLAIGGLVVLLALPIVVGTLLPAAYSGAAERLIAGRPEHVWARLTDIAAQPISGTMCRKTERLPDVGGRSAWREDLGSSQLSFQVLEWAAPTRYVVAGQDSIVPMTTRWVMTLAPEGDATRVRIEQTGTIESGTWHVPIFRFVMHVFGGAQRGPADFLKRLETSSAR